MKKKNYHIMSKVKVELVKMCKIGFSAARAKKGKNKACLIGTMSVKKKHCRKNKKKISERTKIEKKNKHTIYKSLRQKSNLHVQKDEREWTNNKNADNWMGEMERMTWILALLESK